MSTQVTQNTSAEKQTTLPIEVAPTPAWKEIVPLSKVLFGIGRDSRKDPENYLDDIVVPHGGE